MAERAEPSFLRIVQIHQLQAMLHLGAIPNPTTGKPNAVDLDRARHELRLLEILQEKTRGNLTEEEERLLDQIVETLQRTLESA